ncbi:MAG: 3-oxoacyl-[acyl-carrier-protein] synthase III C-terminal domain-containing protein [Planctomycetaceae bacterium]
MVHQPFDLILTDFSPVLVERGLSQEKTVDALSFGIAKSYCIRNEVFDDEEANRHYNHVRELVRRYSVSSKYIANRYTAVTVTEADRVPERLREGGNFTPMESDDRLFHGLRISHSMPNGLSLQDRMVIYDEFVTSVIEQMYQGDDTPPDDIVHVTCSGYVAPNPVERMVSSKGWQSTIMNCYHKGCYAFFPGLRHAAGAYASAICNWTAPKQRIDVVHTELLSLHTKLCSAKPEDIVTQTLFSDGFIKYSLVPAGAPHRSDCEYGLKLLTFRENLIPGAIDDMTWKIGDNQFDMTLSLDVPIQVRMHAESFMNSLFSQADLDFEAEKSKVYCAVHPGGPKIIDFIRGALGLSREQVHHSYRVLKDYGNMSSATVPFLLHEVLHDGDIPEGTLIPAVAFGPGLTMSGAIFQKVRLSNTATVSRNGH